DAQVMSPSTSSLVIPASSSANLAPLTYSCVALNCGTTPTSVSAAPTIATLPRSDSISLPPSVAHELPHVFRRRAHRTSFARGLQIESPNVMREEKTNKNQGSKKHEDYARFVFSFALFPPP